MFTSSSISRLPFVPVITPSTASSSSQKTTSSTLHLQQSLLLLIKVDLLKRLFQTSLEDNVEHEEIAQIFNFDDPRLDLRCLTNALELFFATVGYVSHHFFNSALLATKMFFETLCSFPVVPEDLSLLSSITSLFGTEVHSIFLHVDDTFEVNDFLKYSHVLSGLKLRLTSQTNLSFLNQYSHLFFARLKQLSLHFDSFVSSGTI
ncbi:hypothetical protein GEMRC1_011285 [Eukaryota sp. GEM-RC1]